MSLIRSRWAAVGAAVAVTLGGGGIAIVSATTPTDAVTFVPITPCRVMDTRTEFNVGPKTSPLGPGEVHTVNATSGNTGNCSGIPTTATGVSLNVTALDASLPTFLTLWATGEAQPEASSLNPVPGAPPTPNAVTTAVNTNGQFDIYNLQGNVQVIVDINGYYTDHDHDDRYYTKGQVDSKDASKADAADVYTTSELDPRLGTDVIVTDGLNTQHDFDIEAVPEALTETVETDRDGRLLISKYVWIQSLNCTPTITNSVLVFITVDDQPVESSFVHVERTTDVDTRLTGVTEEVIAAGSHEVGIGIECGSTAVALDETGVQLTNTSIIVLPSG